MKSLDEVIRAFEVCMKPVSEFENCIGCPYTDETGEPLCCGDDKEDALNYLKEYKELSQMWNDRLDKENSNPPLTWDELKAMEGKPVWVEGSHGCIFDHKSWALVSFMSKDDMKCQLYNSCEFWIGEEDYGTDWQAYRKEKK